VLLPLLLLVLAEVALEGLLAPGAVDWVGDGCKGRDGLVLAGVAEELQPFVRRYNLSKKWTRRRERTQEKRIEKTGSNPLTRERAP
jgi:hypothetical protein